MRVFALLFVMLVVSLSIESVTGLLIINSSRTMLETSIGGDKAYAAKHLVDRLDNFMAEKTIDLINLSQDKYVQDIVESSNTKFQKMDDVSQYVDEKEKEWVASRNQTTTSLERELINAGLSDRLHKLSNISEILYAEKIFGNIIVTNSYGSIVAETAKAGNYVHNSDEWWKLAKSNGLYIGNPKYDEDSGFYSIQLAKRIDDDSGNFIGIVKADLILNRIILLASMGIQEENYHPSKYSLVDKSGKIIFSSTNSNEVVEDIYIHDIIQRNDSQGYYVKHDAGSNDVLVAYAHSKSSGVYAAPDHTMLVEYKTADVLEPITSLSNIMASQLIIEMLATISIIYVISKRISRPIKNLSSATNSMMQGDWNVTAEVKGPDEIKALATSFNKLADHVKIVEKLKSEFVSMISHELKTPLFPIKFSAELLKDPSLYGILNDNQLNAVDQIYQNTIRLESLVEDVLIVQKLESGLEEFTYSDILLDKFMESIVETNAPLMKEKGIEFITYAKETLTFKSDSAKLHHVFANLIKNSVDSVPEKTGKIEIGAKSDDDNLIFYVKDNGIGIPKDKQQNVFKKFYQIDMSFKRKHGGTGLGLSICKGIVEGLGGKIWLESEEGKGTSVFFTVPKSGWPSKT